MDALARAQQQVDNWNGKVHIGDEVDYRVTVLTTQTVRLRTRSLAQLLSDHTPVVWLETKSACVALSHCAPVPKTSPSPPTGWVVAWALVNRSTKEVVSLSKKQPMAHEILPTQDVVELGGVIR